MGSTIKYVESDTDPNIFTDHYPLKVRVKLTLKAINEPRENKGRKPVNPNEKEVDK